MGFWLSKVSRLEKGARFFFIISILYNLLHLPQELHNHLFLSASIGRKSHQRNTLEFQDIIFLFISFSLTCAFFVIMETIHLNSHNRALTYLTVNQKNKSVAGFIAYLHSSSFRYTACCIQLSTICNHSSISCDCVFIIIFPCGANLLPPLMESAIRLTPSSSVLINNDNRCVALEHAT